MLFGFIVIGQWSRDETTGLKSVQGALRAAIVVWTVFRNVWELSLLGWSHKARVRLSCLRKSLSNSRQWIMVNVGHWSTNPMIPCVWWWWSTSTRFWTTRHSAVGKPVKGNVYYNPEKTQRRIVWSWLKIHSGSRSSRLHTVSRRSYIGVLWRHWLACPKKHRNNFWRMNSFYKTNTSCLDVLKWMRL